MLWEPRTLRAQLGPVAAAHLAPFLMGSYDMIWKERLLCHVGKHIDWLCNICRLGKYAQVVVVGLQRVRFDAVATEGSPVREPVEGLPRHELALCAAAADVPRPIGPGKRGPERAETWTFGLPLQAVEVMVQVIVWR